MAKRKQWFDSRQEQEGFSSAKRRDYLWSPPTLKFNGFRGAFPSNKASEALRRETDHSPPSSAEVKKNGINIDFSDRQPRQNIYKIRRFGDKLHLLHQGDEMMEMELVSETSDFINLLKRLSARENRTVFFLRESFKTYIRKMACIGTN
jgi:hypothetical protein